jgi:dolichol-phosphate mannosyltransferase
MGEMGRALVVIPTFNEAGNIGAVLAKLRAVNSSVDVLVVDDSSPDGTGRLVAAEAQGDEDLSLLSRPERAGLGTAYVEGFGLALEKGYAAVVEMDADLSHDPADVPRLLERLEAADLVIGSRYVSGGRIQNWGTLRRFLSKAGNLYARVLMGWTVRDATSGFRAYSSRILQDVDLDGIRSEGYAFQIEMVRRVLLSGGRVVEVPITFSERTGGRSKMSRRIVIEALWRVPGWAIRDRLVSRRRSTGSGAGKGSS